jgi:glycosyltransferase involved in cell wall biosynthesis
MSSMAGRRVRNATNMLLRDTPAAVALRNRRAVGAIRRSGLFDREWYVEQLAGEVPPSDLVEHYVNTGGASGISPSPAFHADWYVATHRHAQSSRYPPFAEYLLTGIRRGEAPHPAFDAKYYLREQPAARSHPAGVLGHYYEIGAASGASPHPQFDARAYERTHPGLGEPPFIHFARAAGRLWRDTQGHRHVSRMVDRFDSVASERWKRDVRAAWRKAGSPAPLVSVITPTKDRAPEVVAAARSVLAQTYPHFQLVIVDDGSRDGTAEALADICTDTRVEFVRRESAGGVAVARNAGLARARGRYVAYLDSDNTWARDFLELMVAFVTTTGVRAAYCVSELRGELNHQFRAMPYDYAALRERNYIDCIVLLHERSLLDEVGGFDESLHRMVDWDLLIRIGEVTDLRLAPFIGTTYDLWEVRDDRITNSEAWGYRYVIKAKYLLDWDSADTERERGLVSVVVAARGPRRDLDRCLTRLIERTEPEGLEILIVDPGSTAARFFELQMLAESHPQVRVVRLSEELPFELATNLGVARARGEKVVVLSSDILVEPGWLPPLLTALDNGAAAAAPLLLKPSGAVASSGVAFARHGLPHDLLRGHPGEAPEAQRPGDRSGIQSGCLAVRAEDLAKVRGLDVFYVNATTSPDLSMRLAAATGRPLRYEPDSVVIQLDRPGGKPPADTDVDNGRHFLRRWQAAIEPDARARWAGLGFSVVGYSAALDMGAREGLAAFRPLVVHDRPMRPLRWAIKMAAPDVVDRRGWGDHYFALGLKRALGRRGHDAVIDCAGAWYRESGHLDDVVLVLRGKARYVPNPDHVTLMWLISHPDTVSAAEVVACDHVLVASLSFAKELSRELGRPVEPLLQCTDPQLFAPGEPDAHRRHPVLFVGNSRGVERPVVRDAIAAGLELAVYGQGWDRFLDPDVIRGTYIPNTELAATYRAAGVVLNDHWEDMGRRGFLSNRLFDLAACGARVVSDEVAGLHDVFGDVVATYRSPDELADVVRQQLKNGGQNEANRNALAARIRSDHSFDARAQRLIEIAEEARRSRDVPA